jgi:hypothetical protein
MPRIVCQRSQRAQVPVLRGEHRGSWPFAAEPGRKACPLNSRHHCPPPTVAAGTASDVQLSIAETLRERRRAA